MESRTMRSTILTLALGALVSACGSADETTTTQDPVKPAAATVLVKTNKFEPASVTVKVGDVVRWSWAGGSHDVVSGAGCTPDDKFTNGSVKSSGSFEHEFTEPGTFDYYCTPHCRMGMTGKIVVVP